MIEFPELPTGFNDTPTIPQRYPKPAIFCPDPSTCPPVALEKMRGNSSAPDCKSMKIYWVSGLSRIFLQNSRLERRPPDETHFSSLLPAACWLAGLLLAACYLLLATCCLLLACCCLLLAALQLAACCWLLAAACTRNDMLYVENPDMRFYWKMIGDVLTHPGRHTTTII